MKKSALLLLLFLVSFSGICQRDISSRNIQNYDLLRDNLLLKYNRTIPSDEEIQSYIDTQIKPAADEAMDTDTDLWVDKTIGSWPDIAYNTNVNTTYWKSRTHLYRVASLARAYSEEGQSWYKNPDVLSTVYLAIDHWAANDYISKNFPGVVIVPQQYIMITYLNIERVEAVPQSYIDKTQFIINKARKPGRYKDHNSAWFSEIQVLISMFYDDLTNLNNQIRQIYAQYTQPLVGDGIKPDGSYHFHGNDLSGKPAYIIQFGVYGSGFISDMDWLEIAAGTPYAFNDFSNFGHIRNYFAHGIGWTYWDDEMDYNMSQRQNNYNKTFNRADVGRKGKQILIKADPSYASEYQKVLTWPNQLIGFKSFWQSDIAIARTANWYASVRMNSNRVLRGESINAENQRGLHQSDGVLMFQQSGKEFENIGALWNWKILPGVTCDQGIDKLFHPSYGNIEALVETSYAGSIGTLESRGMASFINKRVNLYARKSYFFDEDVIVCLGSGINGTSISNVFTSIQQTFNIGDVKDKNGNVLSSGTTIMAANDWVYHDNAVYQSTTPYNVDISFRKDNWSKLERGKVQESEGTIFSTWIDHGKSPNNASYAYFIYPQADGTDITDRISKRPIIIANSENVHAIAVENRLYASFFEAGSITSRANTTITVDKPCLLVIDGDQIFVEDPNHNKEAITVTINGDKYDIIFPTGTNTGRQTMIPIVSTVLSLNEAGNTSIHLYPNPAKDVLNLPGVSDKTTATISDASGKEIIEQKVINGKIDIYSLPPGLYFIVFQDGRSQRISKFMKE